MSAAERKTAKQSKTSFSLCDFKLTNYCSSPLSSPQPKRPIHWNERFLIEKLLVCVIRVSFPLFICLASSHCVHFHLFYRAVNISSSARPANFVFPAMSGKRTTEWRSPCLLFFVFTVYHWHENFRLCFLPQLLCSRRAFLRKLFSGDCDRIKWMIHCLSTSAPTAESFARKRSLFSVAHAFVLVAEFTQRLWKQRTAFVELRRRRIKNW